MKEVHVTQTTSSTSLGRTSADGGVDTSVSQDQIPVAQKANTLSLQVPSDDLLVASQSAPAIINMDGQPVAEKVLSDRSSRSGSNLVPQGRASARSQVSPHSNRRPSSIRKGAVSAKSHQSESGTARAASSTDQVELQDKAAATGAAKKVSDHEVCVKRALKCTCR